MQQLSLTCGDSGPGRRSRGDIWLTRSWTPVPLAGGATSCSLRQQRRRPSAIPPRPRCTHTGLLLWLICVEGTAVLKSSPLRVLCSHQPSLPTQLWLCVGMTCWNIWFCTLGLALTPSGGLSSVPLHQVWLLGGSVWSYKTRYVASKGWITQS